MVNIADDLSKMVVVLRMIKQDFGNSKSVSIQYNMRGINNVGFENFRIFKAMQDFEFAPITILPFS